MAEAGQFEYFQCLLDVKVTRKKRDDESSVTSLKMGSGSRLLDTDHTVAQCH
jgi:hypothetical protein